jgi:3-oxoacyl-[acyl-carrier protein] reductase
MKLGLEGRTVIVTGASGGLGRRIARAFGAERADVVVTYRSARSDAELVAKEIGDRALVVHYDMEDPAAGAAVVEAALQWTGRVDVLVNNAVHWGRTADADRPFEAVPDEEWLGVLRPNA